MERKIHPRSLLTEQDQIFLYAQQKGTVRTNWNIFQAQQQDGRCVCDPSWVTDRWRGADKSPSHRLVHAYGCPRRKPWMQAERLFNP
jgi:hypothetical protein